jgi:hypothetical protein
MFYKKTPMVKVLVQILYQMIINAFGRQIKPRTQIQIVLASILVLFLLIAVPTVSILNNVTSNIKRSQYRFGKLDPLKPPSGFEGSIIWANVSKVDTGKFIMQTRYSFYAMGKYAKDIGDGLNVFSIPVEFITQRKKTSFDQEDVLPTSESKYPIVLGDPNRYPFDSYGSEFVINLRNKETKETIPIIVGIVGAVQSWNFDLYVSELPDNNVRIEAVASRGWIIKFFSSFVLIIMWVLSLTILTLSATIWFRERKVEPPIISLCASLMFALPAIRNTQPGAPSIFTLIIVIGCTADVGGFFWNMALVALAAFLAMLNYIVMYKRVKPVEAAPSNVTKQPEPSDTSIIAPAVIEKGDLRTIELGPPFDEKDRLLQDSK